MWVEEIEALQIKVRKVRTPAGAELYDQPIGSVITPDLPGARRVDKRTIGRQTRSNFVHPVTKHTMGKTEVGDTFEQLFSAKMKKRLEEAFGCCLKLITGAGGGTARNTPLDFRVGERGGEVKTLSARAANQKTAIKKEEVARKVKACSSLGVEPVLVVQVVDQDSGQVMLYGHPAFESKSVKAMRFLGSYRYNARDFRTAQERSGHWGKAEARAAAEKAKEGKGYRFYNHERIYEGLGFKAIGERYDPPDEPGGVIEGGDTVIELRMVKGRAVPFIYTQPDEDEEKVAVVTRHVRTPGGARRYRQPIGSVIRPDLDLDLEPLHPRSRHPHRTTPVPTGIDPREFDFFLANIDPQLAERWRRESATEPDFWAWVVTLPPEDRQAIVLATGEFLALLQRQGKGWLVELEGKSAVRHVRTREGARRYDQPIGSVIVLDIPTPRVRRSVTGRSSASGISYQPSRAVIDALAEGLPVVRPQDKASPFSYEENRRFAKRTVVRGVVSRLDRATHEEMARRGGEMRVRRAAQVYADVPLPADTDPFDHDTIWVNYGMGSEWFIDPTLTSLGYDKPTGTTKSSDQYRRGDDPLMKEKAAEMGVSDFVHGWADTSNDTSTRALAVQEAAEAEFGLVPEAVAPWDPGHTSPSWQEDMEEERANVPLYRKLLRAQYEATQDWLATQKITELTVHRGMKWDVEEDEVVPDWVNGVGEDPETGEPAVLTSKGDGLFLRPLSSWTLNFDTAEDFAAGGSGVTLSTVVPAELVFATPRTGFGCLNEYEIVILAPANGEYVAKEW